MTALAVFGRPATPGHTKTRLARGIGDDAAALLYRAFVLDVLERAHTLPDAQLSFWVAGHTDDPDLNFLPPGLSRQPQPQTDLGARMRDALSTGLTHASAALVVGTDSPTLPPGYLQAAVERLADADVVFGPSADGGYYTVAARRVKNDMFVGVPWSSQRTLTASVEACRAAGLSTALLPPWYDVDTLSDLQLLRAELALNPTRAPHTAEALQGLSRQLALTLALGG